MRLLLRASRKLGTLWQRAYASRMPAPLYVEKLGGAELDLQPQWASFRADQLQVTLTEQPAARPDPDELRFGTSFTDHMLVCEYSKEAGWGRPHIRPFGPLEVHPAAPALHYAVSCFEGMKAYMSEDAGPRLFRPERNMQRFRGSAQRLLLADFCPEEMLKCIKALLRVDRDWFIKRDGWALYIRPCLWGSAGALGIYPSDRTTLSITLSPVGPYFKAGFSPVRLFLEEENVRAWPGGVGARKVAGNYAPTLRPQAEAFQQHGCAQVLYTRCSGGEALVSECGALNIFFLLQGAGPGAGRELCTPPLDGTILPGVTRDSLLALARGLRECAVRERDITVRELQQAHAEGRLLEVFGCGTACAVQPVSALVRASGEELTVSPKGLTEQSLAARLTRQLFDIQYCRTGAPHEWSVPVDD